MWITLNEAWKLLMNLDCSFNIIFSLVSIKVSGNHINCASSNYIFFSPSILSISEDEAKDAFVQFEASKRCYRAAPARHTAALNTHQVRRGR